MHRYVYVGANVYIGYGSLTAKTLQRRTKKDDIKKHIQVSTYQHRFMSIKCSLNCVASIVPANKTSVA